MTKEELERIKQAYNSGLKIQIWFNGYWENFDIREYSMYSEPFSEHRRYRIVGSAYADLAEQKIAELKEENSEAKKIIKYILSIANDKGLKVCDMYGNPEMLKKAEYFIKE